MNFRENGFIPISKTRSITGGVISSEKKGKNTKTTDKSTPGP